MDSGQAKIMSDTDSHDAAGEERRPLHVVIYYWGVGVLLIGLIAALLIYVFAADDAEVDYARQIASGRMYEHNLAVMGGKFAVYADQFNQWFDGLWHGRPLAYTVAVLAVAISLVCFWVAWMTAGPSPSEPDERPKR
jgi:hypothetical protein